MIKQPSFIICPRYKKKREKLISDTLDNILKDISASQNSKNEEKKEISIKTSEMTHAKQFNVSELMEDETLSKSEMEFLRNFEQILFFKDKKSSGFNV